MKSTHKVEVIRIRTIHPCPNADNLGIVYPFAFRGGYQCVVRKDEFKVGDLAAYVVPDTIVPSSEPEFQFLFKPEQVVTKASTRIKVKRLRKNWSQGLLIPARGDWAEGDDVSKELGTSRYEPPEPPSGQLQRGRLTKKPRGFPIPTYDVEAMHRYSQCLTPGEDVMVTEKIHGSQARYTYRFGGFYAGSKGVWRAGDSLPAWLQWLRRLPWVGDFIPAPKDCWTRALAKYPQLRDFLRAHPGYVVYGEVYGNGVQDLTYGCAPGEVRFAAFHILTEEGFMPQHRARNILMNWKVPVVPVLYSGPFDIDNVLRLVDGISVMPGAGHLREGVVVSPANVRSDPRLGGLVHLKVVSNKYLERAA